MRALGWIVAAVLRDVAEISSGGEATLVRSAMHLPFFGFNVALVGPQTGKSTCLQQMTGRAPQGTTATMFPTPKDKGSRLTLFAPTGDLIGMVTVYDTPGIMAMTGRAAGLVRSMSGLVLFSSTTDSRDDIKEWTRGGLPASWSPASQPTVLVAHTPAVEAAPGAQTGNVVTANDTLAPGDALPPRDPDPAWERLFAERVPDVSCRNQVCTGKRNEVQDNAYCKEIKDMELCKEDELCKEEADADRVLDQLVIELLRAERWAEHPDKLGAACADRQAALCTGADAENCSATCRRYITDAIKARQTSWREPPPAPAQLGGRSESPSGTAD